MRTARLGLARAFPLAVLLSTGGACTNTARRPPPPPPPAAPAPSSANAFFGAAPTPPWPFPAGFPFPGGGAPPPGGGGVAPLPGAGAFDPINAVDIGWMRQRAQQLRADLVGALPPVHRQRVENVPMFADPTVGEVNAFAACDDQRLPLMALSDGLLDVASHLAQFKATDEIFGARKTDAYIELIARNQRPGQPVVRPPPGFIDPAQHVDPRKVARQGVLFDELVAFVVGHELAHHYLGHTGCALGGGSRGVHPADLGRALSRAAPVFNQPNEASSDVSGTQNLLAAGANRNPRWTEGGAMLMLTFFGGLDRLTPADVVFGFERTHPPPAFRVPIVQQTAQSWRLAGGAVLPLPF